MTRTRVALMQSSLVWEDPAANRKRLAERIRALPACELIVLPEMFTTGFAMNAHAQAEDADGASVEWMKALAAERSATLVGSIRTRNGETLVNRCNWVAPDGDVTAYDKRHLFRMAGEHHHYSAGQRRVVVQLGDWRVLLLVCYDLRFPVWCRNRDDYDLAIVVANWPAARRHAWRTLLAARAIENQCYCVGVNRIGADDNAVAYAGDSLGVDFKGELMCDLENRDEDVVIELALDELQRFRQRFPAHLDADAFTLDLG